MCCVLVKPSKRIEKFKQLRENASERKGLQTRKENDDVFFLLLSAALPKAEEEKTTPLEQNRRELLFQNSKEQWD